MQESYEIVQAGKLLAEINLFVRARPLQRPRCSTIGSVYQPKENQQELIDLLGLYPPYQFDEPILVEAHVFLNSKRAYADSQRLGDVDNIAKGILDALQDKNNLQIKNDSKIVGLNITKNSTALDDFVQIKIFKAIKRGIEIEITNQIKV